MLEFRCKDAAVTIDPARGGRLASLKVCGHELLVTGSEDPLGWGCYPMAPWVGRTRHGRFAFDGCEHSLPITLAPHAIHGTTWQRPWDVVDEKTLRISLGADWPFGGFAEQTIELLDDRVKLGLTVFAHEQAFPASIGWHPWFRRDIGAVARARLQFEAESMYAVDREQIPTGELIAPTEGPWDDCFCDVHKAPRINWDGAMSLELRSNLDHWVVYEQPAHAICVEPMSGPPNALNSEAFVVRPGQPLRGQLELIWSFP